MPNWPKPTDEQEYESELGYLLEYHGHNVSPVLGSGASDAPVSLVDVERVLAVDVEKGDCAETDVKALLKLRDGRFAYASGGCDTTGWDCQSGGSVAVDTDLARLAQLGIPESAPAVIREAASSP